MWDVLERACVRAGLDSAGADLLRGHTNAVIRLKQAPVVVKIAKRGSQLQAVQRTVKFVHWLMDIGFPTGPLHPVPEQPVVIDGHPVTFWTYLPQPDEPVTAASIARPLYALHQLPAPPVQLRRQDNAAAIRASLSVINTLPDTTLRYLSQRLDVLSRDVGNGRHACRGA